jgi:hypothetical protein
MGASTFGPYDPREVLAQISEMEMWLSLKLPAVGATVQGPF